jgi:arylsulfatase A-like enzyme
MKRRTFLKEVGLVSAGLAASTVFPNVASGQVEANADKATDPSNTTAEGPNILVILVDQLRFPQGSFNQSLMDAAAPNLAKLRGQSVSFGHHYAAATACSPSRATLLTGLYTHQNGMFLTNTVGLAGSLPTPDLNRGFPTWGTLLSSPPIGYKTYWWGKWHLSGNDSTTPGYATEYGFTDGGLPCPSPNGGPAQGLGVDPVTTQVFKNWLNASANAGPWCTTVSLVNPHDIQWFPKYAPNEPGEDNPPAIPEFHAALPANFEKWPEALAAQGKPALQQAWVLLSDAVFGTMPTNLGAQGFPDLWYELLDLYYQVTHYVDLQVGAVLDALADSSVANNTIVVFTSDHGEYGGAHGLHGKGFAVYEEAIRMPLYVLDPTGKFIPPGQAGTERDELTSHVDIAALLMTLASGGNAWRTNPQYAHLAGRADLAAMLSDPNAKGRDYILHTSDEDIPEEGPKLGFAYQDIIVNKSVPGQPPSHVIGYRTKTAKLGVNSYFAPGTIQIVTDGQQAEMYDYATHGIDEVINNAPGGSAPEPTLYATLYDALFNPTSGALVNELRQPLPASLQPVQQQAMSAYLAHEAWVQASSYQYMPQVQK